MDMDLNLENYELSDLLNLFKLDYDFNESDLKKVKKTVLQTHPDKSPQLDKEYFLFFSEAYKVICSVYQFRNKSTNKNTDYILEKDEEKEELLNEMKSNSNFNKIFNELFDQYKLKDNDAETGYGEWLKSDEDIDFRSTTLTGMNESFQTKKKEVQAIMRVEDYGENGSTSSSSHYDLTRDKPEYYSSGLFSNLAYEDLKKAHVESVIPVTHEDYLRRPKFNTVEELQRSSDYQNIKPLSQVQAKEYLEQRNYNESKNDVQRAFKLAKQDEEARKANDGWMSKFKTLLPKV
jgi:hypothetical protein